MPVMDFKKVYAEKKMVRSYLLVSVIIGAIYGTIEYYIKLFTDDPEDFMPLLLKASLGGLCIMGFVLLFELLFKHKFTQKRFSYLVLIRSLAYTFIITFWLIIINSIWFTISEEVTFEEELIIYIKEDTFLVNLISVFSVAILVVGLGQINKLHRRGELIDFVLGKYHTPREVDRIFCFIDLKASTTIAEKLGHIDFANFLKDYYSDITEALRETNARIYQYVGDEVVLSWSFKRGLENNNSINCFFKMQEIINGMKQKYLTKYGVYPEFKAGMHGGKVIITWIGELKKEIVYIGDVLNTTARIQEDCKRLAKDFLISGDLLEKMSGLANIKASFVEETIPRGKEDCVRLYSLEVLA